MVYYFKTVKKDGVDLTIITLVYLAQLEDISVNLQRLTNFLNDD